MSNHVRAFSLLRRFIIIVLFSICILCVCTALADTLNLPNSLEIIEDEAFCFDSSLDEVIVPDGTTTIRSKAFAYSGLQEISLPRSLSFIAEDAFEGCQQFSVKVPMNCYAYTWCLDHGYISRPDPTPEEFFTYATINGLYARITGYTGTDTVVVIPEEIDDYIIQEISDNAFKNNKDIETIYLPNTVTKIGSSVFYGCTNLTGVDVGESLEVIGNNAFYGCIALVGVSFPETLTTTGNSLFENCTSLEFFDYPINWSSAGSKTIAGCPQINELIIPVGATIVPNNAFMNCQNITSISISSTIETIGIDSFKNCSGLTEIVIPGNVKTIGGFAGCGHLQTVTLYDGLNNISDRAFENCSSLSSFTMPNTLISIGYCAFRNCTQLTQLDLPAGLIQISSGAFQGCTGFTDLSIPDTVTTIGSMAFADCSNLSSFHYPVSWINTPRGEPDGSGRYDFGNIFKNCTKLRRIEIPEGVETIPDYAFYNATYVRTIILPSTLKNLGYWAFRNCEAITSIDIPNGLLTIGSGAFNGCTYLTALNLPDTVTTIGSMAFANCTNLSSFHYPAGWTTTTRGEPDGTGHYDFGNNFKNCTNLTYIDIPDGVSAIPSYAFSGSSGIIEVNAPDSLTTIGKEAFKNCTVFEKIYLGYNVTSLGSNVFTNCPELTVWCEYGSTVLQYCKNNSIAYYYLTPDGVNNPSGTLYKGDSYGLHGYARASIPLIDVTATIWNSDRSEIVQTISINPGETDYSLSSEINANMLFGTLDLGSYHYTLTASTEMSEEQWANTSFTIVPPPLRVSVRGISSLSGVVGNDYSLSGTIYSNYPITNLAATLSNLSTGSISLQYSTSPNTTSYNLSNLNSRINWANLSVGYYNLSISVSGNGETKTPVNAYFSIGDYDGEIDTTLYDQMISFVGNDDNFSLFNQFNDGWSFISSLDTVDMLNLSWQFKSDMVKDKIKNVLTGDDLSRFKIKQYKKEILAIIDDLDPSITLTNSSSTYNKFIQSMVSNNRIMFTQDPDDPFVSYYMMNMSKVLNFQFDKIDKLCDINSWIMNAKDYYSEIIQNYENSLRILEVYSGYDGISNPEMKKAVEEIAEDYSSKVLKSLHKLNDKILEQLAKYTYKEAIKMFGTSVGQLYKIVTFAVDAALEFNGYDKVADAMMDVIIRVDIYGQALSSYRQAFNTVKNGDTSSAALNRLGMSYQVCCTSCYRMYEALATTAWYEREFNENSRLMEIYSELRRMSYREPFVHWRTGQ